MSNKHISLNQWIEEKGINKVSELLGVERSTVSHWKRGHCFPRVDQMRQIKKLTKGRVGYEQIIDQTLNGGR